MEGGCPNAEIARKGLFVCSRGILAAGLLSLALILKLVLLKFVVGDLVLRSSVLRLLAWRRMALEMVLWAHFEWRKLQFWRLSRPKIRVRGLHSKSVALMTRK